MVSPDILNFLASRLKDQYIYKDPLTGHREAWLKPKTTGVIQILYSSMLPCDSWISVCFRVLHYIIWLILNIDIFEENTFKAKFD